ncbi:MAG: tRNA (guanosine(46)-N7)-methyltransferase TrmB [Clostridiaceae bacterium]|nr:tRNA (guanosine(46)-N7)-methyltransferase TrmB [Clostridiaceae bacterium]
MRLRNVPKSLEPVRNNPSYVDRPDELKGKWSEYFNNSNSIYMEIGSGKGQFITTHAKSNESINYIAMERYSAVLGILIKKVPEEGLPNLAIIDADAENLLDYFDDGELERIFLNFSDPWPKKRHAKRRLTNIRYLEIYKKLLKDDGIIVLKTDNQDFFDFSIEQFELAGFLLKDITYDLHNSPLVEGNITTEYEERYLNQGLPIYGLTAYKLNSYDLGLV